MIKDLSLQQPAGSASAHSLGKGGRQVSWRDSQEGTYWIRLKSPSCPISKHRQQQMLRSTSVSHAQKRRKVLRNMKKKKCLLAKIPYGKKKTTPNPPPKPKKTTCCPEEQQSSQTSRPTFICERVRYEEHQVSARLVAAHGSPGLQAVGLPEDQGLLRQLLLPSPADGGVAKRVLAPICPFIGNQVH